VQNKLSGFSHFTKNNREYLGDSKTNIIVSITQHKNCLAEKYTGFVFEKYLGELIPRIYTPPKNNHTFFLGKDLGIYFSLFFAQYKLSRFSLF
jgi:hypothetical protein